MSKAKDQDAALAAVYAKVPKIECKGKCWMSCSIIEMSPRENQRIKERGYKIMSRKEALSRDEEHFCEALVNGKCAVYELRPMICRLWGVTEGMVCNFGCKPERTLSYLEGLELLHEAVEAGGGDYGASVEEGQQQIRELARANPQFAAELRRIMDAGIEGDIRKAYVHGEERHNPLY